MVKKKRSRAKRKDFKEKCYKHPHGMTGGVYFLAFIGAAVYYIGQADGFWVGVLGFLKALVWPVMLIHKVFTLLEM